ncbi:MAG: PLP-dependent aminotransferase family protein [Sphingobium sp.]|uniref:aminotransferase-like domain-containing protein n=1 Tax=Sphingobium sp. TaxID=1912891 RepID=UPI0029A98D55|nr:PLP-dependent aminotransferase family protein [Sphingobium sp.]MDX3910671.1 PLP-dependent aminotransferase family protein [Sphingobium sp.]
MTGTAPQKIQLPDLPGALHERLAIAVERLIGERRYHPGDRLPTHRELAQRAGVSIGTVTKALDLLSNRGILRGEVGRGTFVNDVRIPPIEGGIIDLAINGPPQVISEDTFRAAGERALRRALALPHGGYADQRGTAEQRRTLAAWLRRSRLDLDEDQLILTVGVQHGVHLAFQDLRTDSRIIATESATYPGALAAARALDMRMVPVRHDSDGMIPDDLDRVLRESGARIVYLTPVCQNPLGFEIGEDRRRELVVVIEKYDAWIVEDDIYSVYSTKGGKTFKEMAPERTYYLNSVSKCLTPLIRVGIMAPPLDRRSEIAKALRAEVWGSAPFGAEMACALLDLGADATAASILRAEAKGRIQLARRVVGLDSIPMPEGAPHLWLPMEPVRAEKLARLAGERGVRLTPPDASFVGGDCGGGVRLSVMATTNRDDLERALRIVSALLDEPEEMIV